MTTPDDRDSASPSGAPPLPPGQMFAPGSELILADRYEANAVAGYALDGRGGEQLVVHCSFEGRRNRSTERAAVTVALSPMDALLLLDQLLKAYAVIERRAAATGRAA